MQTEEIKSKLGDTFFYVIMNSDGQFYRRKGYQGYGESWVDKLDTARIYVKLSPARTQVSYFANAFPQYPPPSIIKLSMNFVEVLDESERIQKAQAKRKRKIETEEIRDKAYQLKWAQKEFDEAKQKLEQLHPTSK